MNKANGNKSSSTFQPLVLIEEKLEEIGVEIVTVNSVLAGQATFTVSFDPARLQEYIAQ
jgi:hypothetical protein